MSDEILKSVSDYYSDKIKTHGNTPLGVDWNGEESQKIRFEQLTKIIPSGYDGEFSITDLGCGYAALYDFLASGESDFSYMGYDVSKEMVDAAKQRLKNKPNFNISQSEVITSKSTFGIASGIFSVRLETSDEAWLNYIESILDNMNDYCIDGFAFNCLTSYSDKEKMKSNLYYANPNQLFDLCKRKYSRNVALLHDYSLYEFTILVRK